MRVTFGVLNALSALVLLIGVFGVVQPRFWGLDVPLTLIALVELVSAVASTVERDRYSAQLVTKVPPESITALDQALTRWARRTDRRLSLINKWLPKSLLGRHPRWHR